MILVEEWKQHFISVSNIMGEYECEYWKIVKFNGYWKIIGKNIPFEFYSLLNNNKKEYTDLDIILNDLFMLDHQTKNLLRPEHHWLPEECPEIPWKLCIERIKDG